MTATHAITHGVGRRRTVLIAATFVGGLVSEALQAECDARGILIATQQAPYGQVVEQLLHPASTTRADFPDAVVLLVRPEDALRTSADGAYTGATNSATKSRADAWLDALVGALPEAAAQLCGSVFMCVMASDSRFEGEPGTAAWLRDARRRLNDCASGHGIELIDTGHEGGPVDDPHLDVLAHIPYRQHYLELMGRRIARVLHARWQHPVKVIAVDCDDTLWLGSCAELGPDGVGLDDDYLALQRFLIDLCANGRLLCLISHNTPEDVFAVLASGRCVLRAEHVVAHRIAWRSKSELLLELAAELGVGIESFVFLDDNPIQRSEVATRLPAVRVIDMPLCPAERVQRLRDTWELDHPPVTRADRMRVQMYREELARRQLRGQYRTHDEFLRSLELRVMIEPMTPETVERCAQLAVRTNQFNTMTERYTITDLNGIQQDGAEVWVVYAADRLGEYGQVGLAVTAVDGVMLRIDALALSCRVLGKGVEDAVLRHLAAQAAKHACAGLKLTVSKTRRNQPAQDAARRIAGGAVEEDEAQIVVTAPWGTLLAGADPPDPSKPSSPPSTV